MIEHMVKEINTCLKNDLQIAALTMADITGYLWKSVPSTSER